MSQTCIPGGPSLYLQEESILFFGDGRMLGRIQAKRPRSVPLSLSSVHLTHSVQASFHLTDCPVFVTPEWKSVCFSVSLGLYFQRFQHHVKFTLCKFACFFSCYSIFSDRVLSHEPSHNHEGDCFPPLL